MWFKVVLTVMFALGAGSTLSSIGQERKSVTSGEALLQLVISGLLIWGIWCVL